VPVVGKWWWSCGTSQRASEGDSRHRLWAPGEGSSSLCHRTNPTVECPLSKNSSKCSAAKHSHSEEEDENRAKICIMHLEEARKVILLYAIINIIAPFWTGNKNPICICYFYITILLYYVVFRPSTTSMELLCTRQ